MVDHITLLGAEQVHNAASRMQSAADSMNSAASSIQYALQQHEQFLERWLADFRDAVESKKEQP